MVWHVATFRLVDPSKAEEAAGLLRRLENIVPGIIEYQVGIDFMKAPNSADVCLVGKFDSRESFDAYMNHPVHTDEVAPDLIELVDYEIIERMASTDFETPD